MFYIDVGIEYFIVVNKFVSSAYDMNESKCLHGLIVECRSCK